MPAVVADDVPDLDNKLFESSSLVSARVLLVIGEPTETFPSLKDSVVLVLSALLGIVEPREPRVHCPEMSFVPSEKDVELEGTCCDDPREVSSFAFSLMHKFARARAELVKELIL